MNNSESNKEIKFIFLPNFNISATFNSGAIGVFIGIFSGIIIELLINNQWEYEKIIFLVGSVIAVILLWRAIEQNNLVKELCEDIKFKDKENKFKTVNSVLNELWNQQNSKNKFLYRKHKHRFYLFLYSSFFIIISCAIFYISPNTINTGASVGYKPKQIIKDSTKIRDCQTMNSDSLHCKTKYSPIKQGGVELPH